MFLNTRINIKLITLIILTFVLASSEITPQEVLSAEDILQLKSCREIQISPDGSMIAYTVSIPRTANEKPGGAYSNLYVISLEDKKPIPFVTGKVYVSSIQWKPDGSVITFRTSRDGPTQVWGINLTGGEAYPLTFSETSVISYKWRPDGKKIGYIASTPISKKEKMLKDKGYGFVFYEENLRNNNLYIKCSCSSESCKATQLTEGVQVWGFTFGPDNNTMAIDITEKNLIDHRYMFRKVYLLDIESDKMTKVIDTPGKLGNYVFSPDGNKLAYTAALNRKDHQVSQVFVINSDGTGLKNLTPKNFVGHVSWVTWKDNSTLLYFSGEKVWPKLSLVDIKDGEQEVILNSEDSGLIFSTPSISKNFETFALTVHSPKHPTEAAVWIGGKLPEVLTNLNPVLSERNMGKQDVFRYRSRDGVELEGLLIYPVDYKKDKSYPLVVVVHGGPESHYSNGWLTRYSRPGQVLAGKGYAVFYPNYRASTGYGVDFALTGYEDPAGKEFDDIADGIDALINSGIADVNRVGLCGGSYGGYAAAWFSSYYTEKVKAVGMFVGISDLISKRGTTDIPYEELYVHSGKKLEEMWEESLKASPIYYAHKSKSAVLIMGGTDDTRVHPSQSIEYYRRLKMNDHPAVRLVQYPGEGHGNRKQPGQIDVLYRLMDWFDWYVKKGKPIDGEMPPLDISEKYGLN